MAMCGGPVQNQGGYGGQAQQGVGYGMPPDAPQGGGGGGCGQGCGNQGGGGGGGDMQASVMPEPAGASNSWGSSGGGWSQGGKDAGYGPGGGGSPYGGYPSPGGQGPYAGNAGGGLQPYTGGQGGGGWGQSYAQGGQGQGNVLQNLMGQLQGGRGMQMGPMQSMWGGRGGPNAGGMQQMYNMRQQLGAQMGAQEAMPGGGAVTKPLNVANPAAPAAGPVPPAPQGVPGMAAGNFTGQNTTANSAQAIQQAIARGNQSGLAGSGSQATNAAINSMAQGGTNYHPDQIAVAGMDDATRQKLRSTYATPQAWAAATGANPATMGKTWADYGM